MAAIHRVQRAPVRPLSGWYTDPVGRNWAKLLGLARAGEAPFTESFAEEIPYLVELEALSTMPTTLQMRHRDLRSDNLPPLAAGGVCVIDGRTQDSMTRHWKLPMVLFSFGSDDAGRTGDVYTAYGPPAARYGSPGATTSRW